MKLSLPSVPGESVSLSMQGYRHWKQAEYKLLFSLCALLWSKKYFFYHNNIPFQITTNARARLTSVFFASLIIKCPPVLPPIWDRLTPTEETKPLLPECFSGSGHLSPPAGYCADPQLPRNRCRRKRRKISSNGDFYLTPTH